MRNDKRERLPLRQLLANRERDAETLVAVGRLAQLIQDNETIIGHGLQQIRELIHFDGERGHAPAFEGHVVGELRV